MKNKIIGFCGLLLVSGTLYSGVVMFDTDGDNQSVQIKCEWFDAQMDIVVYYPGGRNFSLNRNSAMCDEIRDIIQ